MPTTTDLIGLAIDKNPVDFADMFNQLIMQKASDAIENHRQQLAADIYGNEATDENEEDFEDYAPATDETDEKDIDLDDIDLDDLDLEDIADDQENDQ